MNELWKCDKIFLQYLKKNIYIYRQGMIFELNINGSIYIYQLTYDLSYYMENYRSMISLNTKSSLVDIHD
jgi:hypothetical protein